MKQSRLTPQRRLILGVVKSACYHPTADQIHQLVHRQIPNISVGTVYRNLDVLASQRLIQKIDIPGEPARFDADPGHKAYFVCRDKGAIYDLDLDPALLSKILKAHPAIDTIDNFSLVVFGIAKDSASERRMRKGRVNQFLN